jgi:hypothetical protein
MSADIANMALRSIIRQVAATPAEQYDIGYLRGQIVAGMKWTDRHQGLMLAGVAVVALIGFQICRLTGAGEF